MPTPTNASVVNAVVHLVHAITDLTNQIRSQQSSAPTLTPWSLLTAIAGLVAFHIGLFTLVGRERKSPYIINWIFPIFLTCLVAATLSLSAALCESTWWHGFLLACGAVALIVAFLVSVVCVYRIRVRFVYFVDVMHPKHFPIIRHIRRFLRVIQPRSYAHTPTPISSDVAEKVLMVLSKIAGQTCISAQDVISVAARVDSYDDANALLLELSTIFLHHNYSVQYLTAARHPIDLVKTLKAHIESLQLQSWDSVAKRVVVIDGYSPHFAFLDSIYARKNRELAELGVSYIVSRMTYAGLHTAASNAFNEIQKQMGTDYREPTLVVYEGCYALADLESPEQYRIFVRHVLPSERAWGGMLTVFVEAAVPDQDWNLTAAYAKVHKDLRRDSRDSRTRPGLTGA